MPSGIYIRTEFHLKINSNSHKGIKCSEETKRKLSKKLKNQKKPPRSEEHRKKISESKRDYYANGGTGGMSNKCHSEETKKKISKSLKEFFISSGIHPFKGKHHSEKTKEKMREYWKSYYINGGINSNEGKKCPHSKETKKKISKANKGRKLTEEWKEKISKSLKGKKRKPLTEDHRRKLSKLQKGKKSHFWKGGRTSSNKVIRESFEYKLWREKVFERDNYTCIWCGTKSGMGKKILLNADHYPISFAYIISENNIKTMKEALKCKKLWDINNGRTLCEECHKKTDNYLNKGKI